MSRVYFFGCWGGYGHYLFKPSGIAPVDEDRILPWPRLDATLAPGQDRRRYHGSVPYEVQHEGLAALHHNDGWTALAFWDRSLDKRYGSNSVFIAEGTHTFEEMLALGREQFPAVWKRITSAFEIVLVVGGGS